MTERYAIGWNIQGHELILQDWTTGQARLFDDYEDAVSVASELVKDVGECRILQIVRGSDPPENISSEDHETVDSDDK